MDWRHISELLKAGQAVFWELKNCASGTRPNRSKHELIFVFKVGTSAHTNTFGLGDGGRYRTKFWDYAGVNTTGRRVDAETGTSGVPTKLACELRRRIIPTQAGAEPGTPAPTQPGRGHAKAESGAKEDPRRPN
jgi:hypothetical protein